MQEHVRNSLAREGAVLRRDTVSTLTRFVDGLAARMGIGEVPQPAVLEAVVAGVLADRCPAEYEALAGQAGFHRHMAGSIEALALAGVAPARLDGALRDVYGRVLRALERRKVALRGTRLALVTAQLGPEHLAGISELLLDGFFNFSNTERALLERLGELIVVRVTATESGRSPRQPAVRLVAANDQTHEVEWVTGEVLRLVREGVPLRRIGILLRNPGTYGPLVEATLERLAVPSRSYLGTPLVQHPVVAFYRQWIAALEAEWENEALLGAWRWTLTDWGGSSAGDELEFRVREALPSTSLELFPGMERFADWVGREFSPADAVVELKQLASWLTPPIDVPARADVAWTWRQRTTALRMLWEILDATAATIERPLTLLAFWRLVEANLPSASLNERDERRDVLHVMDLFEARQWDLEYVFALGLSEGEFPKRFTPDALLTEPIKRTFGLKTMEDRNTEEHLLYEMLLTRASREVVLTWPRINAKGDPLEPTPLATLEAEAAAPVAIEMPEPLVATNLGQVGRAYRAGKPWSASEFELYLNCPWRHFAARGLELEGLPERPAERLNPPLLGEVAHRVIQIWTRNPQRNIESIAERELERACRDARVPLGYQFERERINLLRNLRLYARYAPEIPAGWDARLEEAFEFRMPDNGPVVRGRIDRYDVSPGGEIHAYDYKYSKSDGLNDRYPIQGALYAMALGTGVSRFSYIALREQARPAVMEGETLTNAIGLAQEMISGVVASVVAGSVPVQPRDARNCMYCEFLDACRIRTVEAATEEEALGA